MATEPVGGILVSPVLTHGEWQFTHVEAVQLQDIADVIAQMIHGINTLRVYTIGPVTTDIESFTTEKISEPPQLEMIESLTTTTSDVPVLFDGHGNIASR